MGSRALFLLPELPLYSCWVVLCSRCVVLSCVLLVLSRVVTRVVSCCTRVVSCWLVLARVVTCVVF